MPGPRSPELGRVWYSLVLAHASNPGQIQVTRVQMVRSCSISLQTSHLLTPLDTLNLIIPWHGQLGQGVHAIVRSFQGSLALLYKLLYKLFFVKGCQRCQKGFQGISGLRWVLGIFDPCPKAQPDSYKSELLPADVPKMSVEAVT